MIHGEEEEKCVRSFGKESKRREKFPFVRQSNNVQQRKERKKKDLDYSRGKRAEPTLKKKMEKRWKRKEKIYFGDIALFLFSSSYIVTHMQIT